MGKIQMTSQMGRIQISQTAGEMNISQPKADISITQPNAHLLIQTTNGKLTIDQSQAFEEANLYGPLRAIKKEAQAGRQAIQEGTRRRAAEGTQLADIHIEGNPIAEQAKQKGHRQYTPPSIKYIPSPLSVKTNYEKGKLSMDVKPNEPQIDVKINKPVIDYR
ncbi:MAG TPA: DUF6470 family protein, partial [Atopostipes sp.]|nr:DUF6470 family protein [Atopostipes sp.]